MRLKLKAANALDVKTIFLILLLALSFLSLQSYAQNSQNSPVAQAAEELLQNENASDGGNVAKCDHRNLLCGVVLLL